MGRQSQLYFQTVSKTCYMFRRVFRSDQHVLNNKTYCPRIQLWLTAHLFICLVMHHNGMSNPKIKESQCLQSLDNPKKRRHWNLKEEALDRTLENSLWKRLWTCRKTDYEMNEFKKYTGRVILSGCVVCACFCVARKDLCTPPPQRIPTQKSRACA
jgi:hypothetical protein